MKLLELDDYVINLVLALFILINFNETVGLIYLGMLLVDAFSYYIARDSRLFNVLPVERNSKNRWMNLVWAMGAYVVFIIFAGFVMAKFSVVEGSAFEQISSLISTTFSATPILYGSAILKLIVWGLIIPIVETRFFFRTLPQWASRMFGLKFPTSIFSVGALGYSGFFGALFATFHLVAKGISSNDALLVTFLFGFVSMMMIIYFKEMLQAIFLHVITNSIATMQMLRIGFFEGAGINLAGGFPILAAIIFTAWFLMFQEIPLLQFSRGAKNGTI